MNAKDYLEYFAGTGPLPLLLGIASVGSLERGADGIQPKDVLRAVYISDLEHVSKFWDDWEEFERIVAIEKLANGISVDYSCRLFYLVRYYVTVNENSGSGELTKLSPALITIIERAKNLAIIRSGPGAAPSSRDMLLSIYENDRELAEELNSSGLKVEKLRSAVQGL